MSERKMTAAARQLAKLLTKDYLDGVACSKCGLQALVVRGDVLECDSCGHQQLSAPAHLN